MNKLKELLRRYFAAYEAHQEHSGAGVGKLGVTTDELAEAIVEAAVEALVGEVQENWPEAESTDPRATEDLETLGGRLRRLLRQGE